MLIDVDVSSLQLYLTLNYAMALEYFTYLPYLRTLCLTMCPQHYSDDHIYSSLTRTRAWHSLLFLLTTSHVSRLHVHLFDHDTTSYKSKVRMILAYKTTFQTSLFMI